MGQQGTAAQAASIGYAFAFATAAVATLLRWALGPAVLPDSALFTLFDVFILVGAWQFGARPAVLAWALACAVGSAWAWSSGASWATLLAYVGIATGSLVAGSVLRHRHPPIAPDAIHTAASAPPVASATTKLDQVDVDTRSASGPNDGGNDAWSLATALLRDLPTQASYVDALGRRRLNSAAMEREPIGLDDVLLQQALAGEPARADVALTTLADGEHNFELRYIPHKGISGKVEGVLVVAQDLSRTHRAEAALELVHRKVSDFLSVLGHELRNPIAAISAASRLLGEVALSAEQHERHRQTIVRQSRRLNRMIEDLLDTSRISSGSVELKPTQVLLRPLLEDIADELALRSLDAEVEVVLVLEAGPEVSVQADTRRLKQAIENVVVNAIEASGPRQSVEVTLAQEDERTLAIRVRDYGTGVPADVFDRMYQPFARAESAPHTGLGLGLHISKRLTELHGGHVHVAAPDDGRGTIVELRLPMQTGVELPPAPRPEPAAPVAGVERRRGRVLLVDDEVDSAEALASYLQLEKHEVRVAYSGVDAIGLAATFRPDVVICDIGLPPPLSGLDVAQALSAQAEAPIVIAFSGYAENHDPARSRAANFFRHITKPSSPEAIAAAIQEALIARGK